MDTCVGPQQQQVILSELDDVQRQMQVWHTRTSNDLRMMHQRFSSQLRRLEEMITAAAGGNNQGSSQQPSNPYATGVASRSGQQSVNTSVNTSTISNSNQQGGSSSSRPMSLEWEALLTPSRSGGNIVDGKQQQGGNGEQLTPSMASPPVSRGTINYDALLDEVGVAGGANTSSNHQHGSQQTSPSKQHNTSAAGIGSRPKAADILNNSKDGSGITGAPSTTTSSSTNTGIGQQQAPLNRNDPCQVLVEFKRRRVLQFESPYYVAPGEHVVVGGDRGEDIGLVTHTWPAGTNKGGAEPALISQGGGKWAGMGLGRVLRVATVLEVSQLQGVQSELELRAVEVAQEKVLEHQLPMRIVDAEYQFDRKKLTFYYQSQHRLDFRTLVRDLYKTFRARIWMEQD